MALVAGRVGWRPMVLAADEEEMEQEEEEWQEEATQVQQERQAPADQGPAASAGPWGNNLGLTGRSMDRVARLTVDSPLTQRRLTVATPLPHP